MAVLSDSERDVEESLDSNKVEEEEESQKHGHSLLQNTFNANNTLELSALRNISEEAASSSSSSLSPGVQSPLPPIDIAGAASVLSQPMLSTCGLMAGYDFPVSYSSVLASRGPRKTRGEKKPIPNDQKDTRYFERRKRNNAAAKKSRDARKKREDEIARKAAALEAENNHLRRGIELIGFSYNSMLLEAIRKELPFSFLNPNNCNREIISQLIKNVKDYQTTKKEE